MKYCGNCGYQTESDQITHCPCCNTPLDVGNKVEVKNQYSVRPRNGSTESVLMKMAFPLILMIIIILIILGTLVNKNAIKAAMQAKPALRHVNSSSTTQSPLVVDVSNTENYTEEMSDNLEDENTQTKTNIITLPSGTLAPASDFIFPYSNAQLLTTADLDNAFADMDDATAAMKSQQAINEIYSRYGYRFHPELSKSAQRASEYFGALDWYNSIVNDSWSNTGEVPINGTESANIDLIAKWQANHGYR